MRALEGDKATVTNLPNLFAAFSHWFQVLFAPKKISSPICMWCIVVLLILGKFAGKFTQNWYILKTCGVFSDKPMIKTTYTPYDLSLNFTFMLTNVPKL